MTFKSTAERLMARIFANVQHIVKNKFNLQVLKKEYNAHGDAVVTVRVYRDHYFQDQIYSANFKLGTDTIEKVDNINRVDGIVETDYLTIVDLVNGIKTSVYQGQKRVESYSVTDALREGRIVTTRITMNEYLGDMLLFNRIYTDALPALQKQVSGIK